MPRPRASARPSEQTVALAIATSTLLGLAAWLVALAHAVGKHGAAAGFRFAPWPVIPLLAIAGWLARGSRHDGDVGCEPRHLPPVRSYAAIVAIGLLCYAPTWSLGFLDPEDWYHLIVVRQAELRGLGPALADAWSYLRGHPGMFVRVAQFPVWYLEDAVFRGWEPGYRMVSLALHVTTAVLVMRVAARVGLTAAAAWIAGFAFVANPASRALVRDPTGLTELLLGFVYGAALLAWLPREPPPTTARSSPAWARYGLLALLIATRDLAATLPVVVAALSLGRALDSRAGDRVDGRGAWRYAWRAAAPTLVVPIVQGALALGELVLDPTSGRPRPANPLGEFGQFAEGVGVLRVAAAFLRDLPRNLLFPVWDKAPEAHLASWVVVGVTLWLVIGLRAERRHRGATLGAAAWVAAPMGLVFPFTTWEGPDNGHLLYLSTAGLGLFVASVWAAIPRSPARNLATLFLAAALVVSVAFHTRQLANDEAASRLVAEAERWLASVDRSEPRDRVVALVGGTDAGGERWKSAILARFAQNGAWRQRYLTTEELWLTQSWDAASAPRSDVAGFDTLGNPRRWRTGARDRIAGLHAGDAPPAGCEPVSRDGALAAACAAEPSATYRTLREVLLTM